MRASLLVIPGAVLLLALFDFIGNTWPTIREVAALQREVEIRLDHGTARLASRGAPPDPALVETLRADLARLVKELDRDHGAVFARSRQSTDYLFPLGQRPAEGGLAAAHKQLELALLPLQLEVREFPALNALDLGVRFPSAVLSRDPTSVTMRDQTERVLLTKWLLSCLRSGEGVDLKRCLLSRVRAGAPLEVDLLVAAGIEDLIPFYENFLAASIAVPPRELLEARLTRLEPENWAPDLDRYRSPPVELLLKVRLMAPEHQLESGSGGGP